ncbi:MAG: bacillithiol biosynthesis cysteine-adding enzyme BshC [Gemmatimonadetes bacterium]|nr:bacillithiol biosynthesis cysteine-adding enzyme BshC [Gemmatimonadota bacterium]
MTLHFEATPFPQSPAPDFRALAAIRLTRLDPALAPAFTAHGPALANRQRLLAGARCITSGQQPGLLTGPVFTIYKAMSAARLAAEAEARLREPVVPVFWVAGDDHDFAEANHCHILGTSGDVERLELRSRPADGPLTPLYREPVGPEIDAVFERLQALTPESEFRGGVLEWLTRHYRPTENLSRAFAGAVAELLAPFGIVVFEASHPAVKAAMAPWLGEALDRAPELSAALDVRGKQLLAEGRPVPVPVGDGASSIMIEGRLGRDRLVAQDGAFSTRRSAERWTGSELRALLKTESERFSPNVLLRPVIEAAILPTLAYVAGPGEMAYLPQADPLYDGLRVAPQARVPRWSGRLIEARVQRVLEKYSVTADALGDGRLETDLARDDLPPEATDALSALREGIEREYGRLLPAATTIDPTLKRPVESARNAALVGAADIEKRLVAHLKRQNETVGSQLAKARASVFPLGKPQERVLTAASFMIRYGDSFLTDARQAMEPEPTRLAPATGKA